MIAFLAIHLPTLLLTDLPRPVCVLAALLVAALVTGFEAISLEGADNLFVPLAVVVILGKITTKPLSEVVFQNLSLLAICLAVGLVVWRFRSFNVGGAITFILFAYGTWSLGSWVWALPVFVGFAGLSRRPGSASPRRATPRASRCGRWRGPCCRRSPCSCWPTAWTATRPSSLPTSPPAPPSSPSAWTPASSAWSRRSGPHAAIVGALGLGILAWAVDRGPALARSSGTRPGSAAGDPGARPASPLSPTPPSSCGIPAARRSRDWTAWRFLLSLAAAGIVLGLQALG